MCLTSVLLGALLLGAAQPADELRTVPEATDWEATSTHAEVVELLDRIEARSDVMRLALLGTTVEGRSIPLAILANPPVATAEQARDSGKAVVFAFGDIHAGEVAGKEALLILARQFAEVPQHPFYDDLVIVLAPIVNGDGNDRMSPENRPGQVGPARGMGRRHNAQDLDLNRDWIKLQSPEVRAIVRFLNRWDPVLTIDTHTTNGSIHRYFLTFEGSSPFVRDEMLPAIAERFRRRYDLDTFFYGNFNDDRTEWRTYPDLPRFGGRYRGLRGDLSILLEAYAYASYRNRISATLEFVRETLGYVAEHRQEVTAQARAPRPDDPVVLRQRLAEGGDPVVIQTLAADGTDAPLDVAVTHRWRHEPTLSVSRPFAYLLPPDLPQVKRKLRQHGIRLERFDGDATVGVYTITGLERAESEFQGHRLVRLDAEIAVEQVSFAGYTIVYTEQPLGTLAAYLLEPQAADGLAAWNFLDEHVRVGAAYPVYRVESPADLRPPAGEASSGDSR